MPHATRPRLTPARLGEQIRTARMRKGWTQTDLSMHSGVQQAVLSRIELGRHRPRLGTLDSIIAALGTNLDKLRMICEVMPREGSGRRPERPYGKTRKERTCTQSR